MNARKVEILEAMQQVCQPLTAEEVAKLVAVERSNASRYLNELAREGQLIKKSGRPVRYRVAISENLGPLENHVSFANLVGTDDSLKVCVQQAKAATLYPPNGLHTILFGETGTGKSMFAECMHQYAISSATLQAEAPFVAFNCADYAQNPQLLVSQIFGVKQGAYTGATEHKAGLLEKAHGGMLFLDEIHRLPPEGQEMLFTFIDKGHYRPLGETSVAKKAKVRIIGATTEHSETFLKTFTRRIPMAITLPTIQNRNFKERFEIILLFIKQEATRLHQQINIEKEALLAFMLYQAEGNIGQIKRDLKLVCAKAFLHYRTHQSTILTLKRADLPVVVKKGLLRQNESVFCRG